MVALLHPSTFQPTPRPVAPRHARPATARPAAARPQLRLIEGGASSQPLDLRIVAAVGFAALLLLVVALRFVQGGPPADTWAGLEQSADVAVASATVGDQILVAGEGDTWWAIAERVAPGADTVEVVKALTAVNGGPGLAVGQQILVPATIGS